jgi:two-component system, chemotaxis family, sensor kinase Cph1
MDKLSQAIRNHTDQNHFCAFYDTADGRLMQLAAFYKIGLERGEQCVFITDQDPVVLADEMRQYGVDITDAIESGAFLIYPVKPTYLPEGDFKVHGMLDNLKVFIKNAEAQQFTSVRAGGDMDWIALKAPGSEDVGIYEAKVNELINTGKLNGLCLFPRNLLDLELTQSVIQAHPTIVVNGNISDNPYYLPPEESFKFDLDLVAQIEGWLDGLQEQDNHIVTAY